MSQSPDILYLKQALTLAETYRGFTAPNPSVGCIIVRDNHILAQGQHAAAGKPHAEADALIHLSESAEGATLYVTLEPCCHHGRTPPCTDAIIKANIKRVVFAYRDPNPLVAGQGQAALQSAGIQCDHIPLTEINAFYQSYAFWHQHKKPFVTAKIAMTLDGKIADTNSQPIALTGKEAQALTHYWRKKSDCILTTAKTIIQDNPQLNARLQDETIAKPLYIIDRNLTLPMHAKIYHTAKSITLFHKEGIKIPSHLASFRCIPIKENAEMLDLQQAIAHIGSDGMHDLWIEAGGQCFSNCLRENLLQRAFIYIAPIVMGRGLPAFSKIVNWSENQVKWRILGKDAICEIEWLREVE